MDLRVSQGHKESQVAVGHTDILENGEYQVTVVCLEYSGSRESEEPEVSKEPMVSLEETVMMESKADRVRSVRQEHLEYRETRGRVEFLVSRDLTVLLVLLVLTVTRAFLERMEVLEAGVLKEELERLAQLDHLERQERGVLKVFLALTDCLVMLDSLEIWDLLDHLACKALLEIQDLRVQEDRLEQLEFQETEDLLDLVDQEVWMVTMAHQEALERKGLREKVEKTD